MKSHLISFSKFILLFLTPILPLMLVIGIVILIDTYFGRRAARAEGYEVTSKRMREGLIPKMIGYQLAIITLFIIDFWAINEIIMYYVPFMYLFTKICGGYIIWIEWTSINESFKIIKGYTINSKIGEFFLFIRGIIKKLTMFKDDITKLNDKKD